MLAKAIDAHCSLPVLPFREVQTNWSVITGVFSSGKTTMVNDLSRHLPNFRVQPDSAREVIERGLAWRGPAGEEMALDKILRTQIFEDTVFSLKWRRHLEADPSHPYLLDYGLPDIVAFSKGCGLSTALYDSRAGLFRYVKVFFLEPLPYVVDSARDWKSGERDEIRQGILSTYERLGYSPVLVPPLPREERTAFVLKEIACR